MTKETLEKVIAQKNETLNALPLKSLFFELTNGCNLHCLHCGSSCSPEQMEFLDIELIKKTLISVSDNIGVKDTLVCLTGGEPLLHPDFFEIAQLITDLGFKWGMTTNATLITPEVAENLAKTKINSVAFSLDGTRETHNKLRGSSLAYDLAIDGIKNGVKAFGNTAVTMITSVIYRDNIDLLEESFKEISALKVDFWRPINVEPIGRANKNAELFLNKDGYEKLFEFIKQKRNKNTRPVVIYGCSHALPDRYENVVRDWYFNCIAGIANASVLYNGDIYACLDIERRPELVQGNVKNDDFYSIWKSKFAFFRADRSDCDQCKDCKDRAFCRGDSAHTWDYDASHPLLCLRKVLQ